MFCEKCGKKLSDSAKFCSECGNNIENNIEKTKFEKTPNIKPLFSKKLLIIVISVLMVVFLATLLIVNQPTKFKLKYKWGTHIDKIREDEHVYEEFSPGDKKGDWFYYDKYTVVCEDPDHAVDRIEEFDITNDRKGTWDYLIFDKVTYEFSAQNKKLIHIYYEFDGMSLGERMEIAKKYFGNNCFVDKYDCAWWRIGNTVIALESDSIDYYDAEEYINMLKSSEHDLGENLNNVLEFIDN